MSVVIKGFNKPASCFGCPFNRSDCWCSITEGFIDRDDYSCDLPCPIEPLPKGHDRLVEARAVIKALFSKKTIDDVPTIVEADKAESEESE